MGKPRYLNLDSHEISELLAFYGDSMEDYRLLTGGSANTNYYIKGIQRKYILTLSQNKGEQELRPLIDALLYLEDHGYETTRIYGNEAGQYINWFGEFPVLLKSYIPGKVPTMLNHDQAFNLGSAIADLHLLPIPDFLPQGFDYDEEHMKDFLSSSGTHHPFTQWLSQFLDQCQSVLRLSLPRAIIHADIFNDNMVIHEGKPVIIDFEEICVYHKIFDLGMAIVGTCREGNGLNLELSKSLVNGYAAQLPLNAEEKEALKYITAFAAASTAFWRFRQFNVIDPNSSLLNHHEEMVQLTDWILKQDFKLTS